MLLRNTYHIIKPLPKLLFFENLKFFKSVTYPTVQRKVLQKFVRYIYLAEVVN